MSRGETFRFRCASCDEVHEGVPTFGADRPEAVFEISPTEREARVALSSDQCIIDGERFFVRGCLETRVAGCDDPFVWGVWVEISEDAFESMAAAWDQAGREATQPPCPGRLDTPLPCLPPTRGLAVKIITRAVGQRPGIVVDPVDHQLSLEQRRGISPERLEAIVEAVLHGDSWPPGIVRGVYDAHVGAWGEPDEVIVFDGARVEDPPPLLRTDVFVWRASAGRTFTAFATGGMSARAMPGDDSFRAELCMGVRGSLDERAEYDIARFLADLATYPWVKVGFGLIKAVKPDVVGEGANVTRWLDAVGARPAVNRDSGAGPRERARDARHPRRRVPP